MYNRDNQESHNREVRRETYQDAQGNTHTNVTRSTDTVNARRATPNEVAYRDGYVSGQIEERQVNNEVQATRDNDNAARGLLLGVILTSILGLIVGTLFFLNQRREEPVVAPVIVPNNSAPARSASPSPSPSVAPRSETTVIERERVVPVPQPQSPAPQPSAPAPTVNVAPPPAPDVNVTIPNSPAPQAAPAQPQSQTNTTAPATGGTSDIGAPTNDAGTTEAADDATDDATNLNQPTGDQSTTDPSTNAAPTGGGTTSR